MRAFRAIVRRELFATLYSPLGWIVLTTFLVSFGYVFHLVLTWLSNPRAPKGNVFPLLFGNPYTWILLILYCSTTTMRLFAEERKSGSIETLMTSPVGDWTAVLGKYVGAAIFYAFLWGTTLAFVGIVAFYSDLDPGPVAAGYLGVLSIGAYFLAIGVFASSLVKNQVAAAIVAFSIMIAVFTAGGLFVFTVDIALLFAGKILSIFGAGDWIASLDANPIWERIGQYLNLWNHMDELGKGIVDTRRIVYSLSGTAFFLWLTARTLESKRWR
jgi:ABC-2 type transport system permease protein